MPVKVYVRRDSQGRELPAKHSHESWGALDLIHRLWRTYNHQSTTVAIAVNLENPSADLVIVSERGIGIIELKDVPGTIRQRPDESWYANYRGSLFNIKGGTKKNPHLQVRGYAYVLKQRSEKLLASWVGNDLERFRLNTSVCFTHPSVDIEHLRQTYRLPPPKWERFHLITPTEVVRWAHTISFEAERLVLTEQQVNALPRQLFKMVESVEIPSIMLTGRPYAYLSLIENGERVQVFSLYPGSSTIGRDLNSTVSIPARYHSVSRYHARILHSTEGTFVQDLDSKYGVYVDGCQVEKERPVNLETTNTVTLCLPDSDDERACVLRFERLPPPPPSTWSMAL